MSRLIDADELLSYIDRVKNSGLGKQKSIEYITKYINNMSIAFDVDKVVRQMDNLRKEYEIEACNMNAPSNYTCYYKGRMRGYEHSIDIVKEGGIDVEG